MNYLKIYGLILALMNSYAISAQGLLIDDARYNQLKVQSQYNDGSKSEFKALDGVRKHSLKAYCPAVQDQGELASCVGWSVGYAALSIQYAIHNDWRGQTDLITNHAFSAHYIFNQIKTGDCHSGAYMDAALMLLQCQGNLTSKEFDTNTADCNRLPTLTETQRAVPNAIVDFMALFREEASDATKINKVKLSLLANKAVIFGWLAPPSFWSDSMKGSDTWQPELGEQDTLGHAMTVIGFDDAKGAFEVMNSWGTDWGNEGYVWIGYEDFAARCKYAFQMGIDENKKRAKIYTAKFNLRRFVDLTATGEPIFEAVNLKWNKKAKHYRINRRAASIERGQVFQLLVSQVNKGAYLYAFGIESDHEIKAYFPLGNESAKITVPEIELFMPSPNSGLQFNKSGTEYIVLLLTSKPITDYDARLQGLQASNALPLNRIYEVFGKEVIPFSDIHYLNRSMQVENELTGGYIIPLVLALEVE